MGLGFIFPTDANGVVEAQVKRQIFRCRFLRLTLKKTIFLSLFGLLLLLGNLLICPDIDIMVRVFANGLRDRGSIPGRVIPKTKKMVLDASLLNTQHYKVWIKCKVEQIQHLSIEKGAFWSPLTMVANFTFFFIDMYIFTDTHKYFITHVNSSIYIYATVCT